MLESPQVKRIMIMVTRSWKLEGPKSFLPPPQIFSSEGKKIPKIYADLDGGLKNYASSIFDLQKTKKVFFFWKLPKKSVHFPDMRPKIHTTPGLNVCTICIRTI